MQRNAAPRYFLPMLDSSETGREICPELLAWAAEENEAGEWGRMYHRDYMANEEQGDAERQYGVYGHYWNEAGEYVYGYRGPWPQLD